MSGLKLHKGNLWQRGKERSRSSTMSENLAYFTPMGGLKPDAYVMPKAVMELVDNIDEIVDKFFENAIIDELNSGAFLDEYIDHIIELGRIALKQQALEHQHMIEGIQSIERGVLLQNLSQQREIQKKLEDVKGNQEVEKENEKTSRCIYKEIIA